MAGVPTKTLRKHQELDDLLRARDHSALRTRQSHTISARLPLDSVSDGLLARPVVYSLVQVHGDHCHTIGSQLTRDRSNVVRVAFPFFRVFFRWSPI